MAHDPALEELLRETPLLQHLDRKVQDELLARIETRRFRAGEAVIETGSSGDTLLVLLRGEVDVYAREGTSRFRVARLGPGELLGEMAFFSPRTPRSADVVGHEAGALAIVPHELYAGLCRTNPQVAASMEKAVLAVLADRLEDTNRTMATLMDRYKTSGLSAAMQWLGRFFGKQERA